MTNIPIGWKIWFHGTPNLYQNFDINKLGINCQDITNIALGIFFAKEIRGALAYAKKEGYILVVATNEDDCLYNESEFWCHNEPFEEDDVDHMGNWRILGGEKTRARLQSQGYRSVAINDLSELGPAKAMFSSEDTKVLGYIPVSRLVGRDIDKEMSYEALNELMIRF